MRRVTLVIALALSLVGCGTKGEQVPLINADVQPPGCCMLMYAVVDVVEDPRVGTAVKGSGAPLRWPTGYTGWRVGSEVEVRDPAGNVVLTTGSRYRIEPTFQVSITQDMSTWVIGSASPCPDCQVGAGVE